MASLPRRLFKSRRVWVTSIVVGFALVGCLVSLHEGFPYPGTVSLSEEDAAIHEAVFRYQFRHNASASQQAAAAYFLLIDDRNPPSDFLARFVGEMPAVRKGSHFRFGGGGGIQFWVGGMTRVDQDNVMVPGGYYEGNLSAAGNIYHVLRKGDVWIVDGVVKGWIA